MDSAMTARWRETISLDDLWEGDMIAVTVDGEAVLLVNIDGNVRAYSNRCPHQASALDEGDLRRRHADLCQAPVGVQRRHRRRHQPG